MPVCCEAEAIRRGYLAARLTGSLAIGDLVCELQHLRVDVVVCLHFFGDLVHCVEHRSVVSPVKEAADRGETEIGVLSERVHGDVAGRDQVFCSAWAEQLLFGQREEICRQIDDVAGCELLRAVMADEVAQDFLGLFVRRRNPQ